MRMLSILILAVSWIYSGEAKAQCTSDADCLHDQKGSKCINSQCGCDSDQECKSGERCQKADSGAQYCSQASSPSSPSSSGKIENPSSSEETPPPPQNSTILGE